MNITTYKVHTVVHVSQMDVREFDKKKLIFTKAVIKIHFAESSNKNWIATCSV